MKRHILFILMIYCHAVNTHAQFCNSKAGLCYQKDSCFSAAQIHSQSYKYATVHNIYKSSTASIDLYITIYSPCGLPENIDDTGSLLSCVHCNRPCILLIHGGGFRTGCKIEMNNECLEFAKRGYVAATIDYRLGWVPGDEKQTCNNNFCFTTQCSAVQGDSCKVEYKDSLSLATYRALQDAFAAMRFIAHYANKLNIDTGCLYIGGHSAGSIMAINICYMHQSDVNRIIPFANRILGPLNSCGNFFTNSFRIAGLFNNWGGIFDTACIKGVKDKIPMIAFHGIDDHIVPFTKGFALACSDSAYGNSYGSNSIFKRLANNYPDLPVELYCCFGGHGIFDKNPGDDLKSLYRIQKAICFFNRVRNGDKTQTYIRINKEQPLITYHQLDSISPVSCSFTGLKDVSSPATALTDNEVLLFKTDEYIISPNPAVLQATLFVKNELKEIDVTLINSNGKILWKRNNIKEKNINLPVQNLADGLYFIMINTKQKSKILKLIKIN
jgi:hypothetical protein